jgi:polyisoprenoid-binding protein YceI
MGFDMKRRLVTRLVVAVLVAGAAVLYGLAGRGVSAAPAKTMAPALPAAGTYKADPNHSFVYFSAWHHVVGRVRGRFDKTTGTITAASDPADCAVDITIDTGTINTQNTERDDDLRSADFFDVKKFSTATYVGRGVRRAGSSWVMDGTLTIRGVSKVVPLTFTFRGLFPDTPAGKPAPASFQGMAETRRGDFGMTRDNLMELGQPPAPGSDVELEIDVEANRSGPD